MYKISFFVTPDYSEAVKSALFSAGAGKVGKYAQCSWETLGVGQFKPLAGSNPFIGRPNVVEQVEELKVEMLCEEVLIQQVINALKQAHPYEEPAYEVVKLEVF